MIRKGFILSELSYRFPQVVHSIHHSEQAVSRPLFFECSERKFNARIIICTPYELNELTDIDQAAPLFVCVGQPDLRVFHALDICVLPETENPLSLFNFIQRLFDRLDEWRQRLKEAAETSADIATLLDCAAGMLQNPLWLCDARCHIVSSAECCKTEENLIDLSSYKLLEQIITDESTPTESALRLSNSDAPALTVACLSAGGAKFALVCAAVDRPFYGSDDIVLEHLSGYVKRMLTDRKLTVRALRQRAENDAFEPLLRALLDQSEPEQDSLAALSKLGWSEDCDYCVAVAETENGDMRASVQHSLCDRIESAFPSCCAFSQPPVVAVVIRAKDMELTQILDSLNELSKDERVRFGICEPLSGLSGLSERLSMAKTILNHSATNGKSIALFSDIAEDYLCTRGVSEYSASLVCLHSVFRMAKYDREHDTNYVETSDLYAKNRFNAVKTANELFIHRSTFLYRLERIKAQFGLDLEAEMTAPLHLFLSLRLAMEALHENHGFLDDC